MSWWFFRTTIRVKLPTLLLLALTGWTLYELTRPTDSSLGYLVEERRKPCPARPPRHCLKPARPVRLQCSHLTAIPISTVGDESEIALELCIADRISGQTLMLKRFTPLVRSLLGKDSNVVNLVLLVGLSLASLVVARLLTGFWIASGDPGARLGAGRILELPRP